MPNENRMIIEQELSEFHAIIAASANLAEFAQSVLNHFTQLTDTDSAALFLRESESDNLKRVAATSDNPLLPMPNTRVGEIVFHDDQVLLPFSFEDKQVGVMILKQANRKRIIEKHFIITEACLLAGLKFHILILTETLNRQRRVINEHLLTYQTSSEGKITEISQALVNQLGLQEEDLIGKSMNQLFPDAHQTQETWDGDDEEKVCVFKTNDGKTVWIKSSEIPTFNFLGEFSGHIYLQEDVTDYQRIKEMSIRDDMTGLYNRRFFNQMFTKEIDQAKRHDIFVGFILIDVDNFKKYNDTYGHQEGDCVLINVAKTLQTCFKRKGDYVFRIGGEEFGVICSVTDPKDIESLANIARTAVEGLQIPHTGNPSKVVTLSAGVVTVSKENPLDDNELYKMADMALYEAKTNGRNQVKVAGHTHDIELF